MAPLLFAALVGVAIGLGWRALRRQHQNVIDALKKAEASLDKRTPVTLEQDPKTGVYRPRRRD
jgi:hypothetical protein